MKRWVISASMLLMSAAAFAGDPLYFAEPLLCHGRVQGTPPSYMVSDYYNVVQKIVSFWSTRKDGSLAPSIEVNNGYYQDGETVDFEKVLGTEIWYTTPLRVSGARVYNEGLGLELTIQKTEVVEGKTVQTLVGTTDVMKGVPYELSCTATVVENPSRIDDYTAR